MEEYKTQKERPGTWPAERVRGFTDGVFSFAVTLLVLNLINLNIPPGNQSLIPIFRENVSALISFIATFIIIARFWMSHARLFAVIKEYDRTIVSLNNTLLFFITVFPFVASILGNHIGNRDAVIMYAACFAIVGILQYLIGRHVYKNQLLTSDNEPNDNKNSLRIFTFFSLSTPMVFIISILLAFISPFIAEALWILLLFLRGGFRQYYKNNHLAETEIDKL